VALLKEFQILSVRLAGLNQSNPRVRRSPYDNAFIRSSPDLGLNEQRHQNKTSKSLFHVLVDITSFEAQSTPVRPHDHADGSLVATEVKVN